MSNASASSRKRNCWRYSISLREARWGGGRTTDKEATTKSPGHIAFIMDGNGRWAEQRGLPRIEGHRASIENLRALIEYLGKRRIPYVTIYVFSTENWNRPDAEVSAIFALLEEVLDKETAKLHERGVRMKHLGDAGALSPGLQESIRRSEELTRQNRAMTLGIAINYGGRQEILDAARRIVADGVAAVDITEDVFRRYLYAPDIPDADLIVRTGGELRTSNFFAWQGVYSEYYFTPVLWPDFNDSEMGKALEEYRRRKRRFGGLELAAG